MDFEEVYAEKKKISSEFLYSLFLLLTLIIACSVMYFWVMPTYEEVKIKELELEIKNENLHSKEKLLVKVENTIVSENEKKYFENIEKIAKLIPNKDNYEDYLAYIGKLDTERNSLKDRKISFSAMGSYSNFINFLASIERGIPFMQVESISMTKDEKDEEKEENSNSSAILNFDIKVNFLHY